jgi:hypothetical protein
MLRIPHCLDSRLTNGGKGVRPTHPPHFTPQKHNNTSNNDDDERSEDVLVLA